MGFFPPGTMRWRTGRGWGSCRLEDLEVEDGKRNISNVGGFSVLPSLVGSLCIGRTALLTWWSSRLLSSSTFEKKNIFYRSSLSSSPFQPWCRFWQGWASPWDRQPGCTAQQTQYLRCHPKLSYSSCNHFIIFETHCTMCRLLSTFPLYLKWPCTQYNEKKGWIQGQT